MNAGTGQTRAVGLGAAVRTVAGLTLVSRVLGLVRDLLTARVFLDSPVASAFAAAFALPNLFRRLFGEGALSAAFLPAYADARENDTEPTTDANGRRLATDADKLAAWTVLVVGGLTTILVVLGEAVLLTLLLLLPESGERGFSFRLMMMLLPFMPLVCVTAVLGGVLHVHGRFAPTAAAPALLNLCMIAAAASHFFRPDASAHTTAYLVGVSALVAGVLQIVWSVRALTPHVRWTRAVADARERARAMLRRFIPAAVGLGAVQLNAFMDTLLAMWPIWVGPTMLGFAYPLDERSNGVLFFTQRLYQFPLGVFGIAVATAIFPLLARTARDEGAFADTLRRGVRLSLFIGLPASVGLMAVSGDLVRVLFAGGGESISFSEEGLRVATSVLVAYAAGVWAYALNHVLARAFYARGDTATPTRVAASMVLLNLALNLTLIWPLKEAGLAWSTAACAAAQTLILAWLLRRRLGPPLLTRGDWRALGGIVALSAAMLGSVLGVGAVLGDRSEWSAWALAVALQVGVGGAVYLGLARLTRRAEWGWLLSRG